MLFLVLWGSGHSHKDCYGCFISHVVGVIAVFSLVSVFSNWVWADNSSLFSARSTDVVDAFETLVVSSEALILLMKLSQSFGSNWIKVLTIVSEIYYVRLLVDCLLLIYMLPSKEYYSDILLLILPSLASLTRSCIHWMIIGTFIWKLIIINVVVRILLTTFPTHFLPSTIIFMVATFLAFVTSQWIGYVLFHALHCITIFYFFWYSWSV